MKIFIVLVAIASIYALPNGAPKRACSNLLPVHGQGNTILKQTGLPPYTVSVLPNSGKLEITIQSNLGLPFQGFMLQARGPNRQPIGVFESFAEDSHTIDCDDAGDTLTHSNTDQKRRVSVEWNPKNYNGVVVFNATVLQDYATFWAGVESSQIDLSKRSLSGVGSNPVIQTSPSTTTPAYYTPEEKQEAATEFDPFYEGCDVRKSCFGTPANCVSKKNCKAVVAVSVLGDKYEFELKATNSPLWVGFGLSDDTFMGDDSVVECVKEGSVVKAYMSYTSPRPNLDVKRLSNSQDGIELISSSQADGTLYCKVRREVRTRVNDQTFDLESNMYHLLVGAGTSIHSNKVSFHDIAYAASGQKQKLSDVAAIAAASKLLLRLHGAFMLAAWIGTASIGILLARYYRQTWVGSQLCGKDQWFAWHRFFMVLTWALTTAGFVLIFVELKAWSTEPNPHAILGVVTTVLCFIQPIGAYFRPHPGTSKRPIFNWAHWFLGNAAHIVAIVTIFFAVKLNKAELPEWFDWIMVAYVAFHAVMHLLLSIMGCQAEKSAERRVTAFPMKDLGGSGRTSSYVDRNADAPFSCQRKFLLALYILVVLIIVVALIFVTVVAPIEEFWENMQQTINKN